MNLYVITASFLGTAVEFVEALTIVLAVGVTKGWRSSLSGMALAILLLTALVVLFGVPLMSYVHVSAFQLVIGILMMMFGMRWLRKAILRYSGLKALHLENEAYEEELTRQKKEGTATKRMDWFGFTTTFNIVLLEGIEAIFIVLTLGLAANELSSAVLGSVIGIIVVIIAGILLRKPLAMIPENTMKFVVGLMLSSFGIFLVGEGVGVEWWHGDVSILVLMAALLLVSILSVGVLQNLQKRRVRNRENSASNHFGSYN
ncbi:COG4280 domain-containing protein [Paenibacillus radicis (ex Xue et al. 2023)]|uniref:GDT1 family protein n=1 Tax=Paenibacillus radicis (ex Xue et al. 2023) TaxID=2972489 RepID=A0ABT1YPE1_9BACL|nr:hypothetical protein [Paenibacillus radicis (ex Xue et al. 2023)]MCR8635049.1 hypothetical protein [Paenibacillus radicis (ex Xue et al. 2023)]